MIAFLTSVHVVICILLVASILMQAGKGGGLAEGFSSAENILGAQTNVFMIRVTTVLGVLFLVSCLTLAFLHAKREGSLMKRLPVQERKAKPVNVDDLFNQKPAETITINAAEPALPVVTANSVAR